MYELTCSSYLIIKLETAQLRTVSSMLHFRLITHMIQASLGVLREYEV